MKKFAAAFAVILLSAGPLMAGEVPSPPTVPVPEPATLGLIAGGAALLGLVAWRRRKDP